MKKAEKTAARITGVVLFAIAALFVVALMQKLLALGSENIFFTKTGAMLTKTYGFSSVLIPVFFIVAGLFCFAEKWSSQRALCLLISVIPFFTISSAEKLCRSWINDGSPVYIIKVVAAMAIAVLLVVIEYLLASIVGGFFNSKNSAENVYDEEKTDASNCEDKIIIDEKENLPVEKKSIFSKKEKPLSLKEEVASISEEDYISQQVDKSVEEAAAWSVEDYINSKAKEKSDEEKTKVSNEEAVSFNPQEYDSDPWGVLSDSVAEENSIEDIADLEEELSGEEETSIEEDENNFAEEITQESYTEPEEFRDDFEIENEEDEVAVENDSEDDDENLDVQIEENYWDVKEEENTEEEESPQEDVPNFEEGSGIEEEPQNPNEVLKGNTLISALDNVFARMEDDAKAELDGSSENQFDPTADAVVDSEGNIKADFETQEKSTVEKEENILTPIPRAVPKKQKHGPYKIPTDLLNPYENDQYWLIDEETRAAGENLKKTLNEFGIEAQITEIQKGPVVTMFEILPASGVKLSKIVALQDNIALCLAAKSVRVVAPIPGKRAVGIEVPNAKRSIVSIRECIEKDLPQWKKMEVPVVLGKTIEGGTQLFDLVKTPHLLIAGSTGSGKSVCVNSLIMSVLYKRNPNEVKMILIDPKIVELKVYNDIPHLLTPVITEPKRAMQALQYALCEMERRYAMLDNLGVRDIVSYNKRVSERNIAQEKLPYIIIIIDEFADLMATTGKELEGVVARLCAMSRAVGIHLVLATQRPSIDVITGLIKANIPSRIAFMVASKTDSRIIIDQVGAEKLLGKGDMLYASATDPFPTRIQGTLVTDEEVERVVEYVKQWGEPEYIDDEIFVDDDEDGSSDQMSLFGSDGEDPLYEKALDIVIQAGKASASYIQRRLKIGYNRAARLVEEMEERGIVGPANGSKPREIIHMV